MADTKDVKTSAEQSEGNSSAGPVPLVVTVPAPPVAATPVSSFAPLKMFVATMEALLTGCNMKVPEAAAALMPSGNVLALNSNFGHKAQPGHESHLKTTRRPPRAGRRERKLQGDGTCFNSSLEPVIRIAHTAADRNKVYYPKCFISTGQTQVPGSLAPDFSDGIQVLAELAAWLNEQLKPPHPIVVKDVKPNMINFKFSLVTRSKLEVINLLVLSEYLRYCENGIPPSSPTVTLTNEIFGEVAVAFVPPPGRVVELKPYREDPRVSFRMAFPPPDAKTPGRKIRVNIFLRGKVNILGADSKENAEAIYAFLDGVFSQNRDHFVQTQPTPDAKEDTDVAPLSAPATPAPKKAAYSVSDAKMAELLKNLLGNRSPQPPHTSVSGTPK